MRILNLLLLTGLSCMLLGGASGCARGGRHLAALGPPGISQPSQHPVEVASPSEEASWPQALPVDRLQPWEEVDGAGFVIPQRRNQEHAASTMNEFNEFTPGVERYSEFGDVTDLGEASRFSSGAAGAGQVSYAFYRVSLGPAQPGAISADVNLRLRDDSTPSSYWLALGDYGNSSWQWRGPFSNSHIRLSIPSGDYTSELGSLFICVLAFDGSSFDLVGLGVNTRNDADSVAPPAPAAPMLTPEAGALLVEWIPVIADDLAGYRIYYSSGEFASGSDKGVQSVNFLVGGMRYLLAPLAEETFVRIAAVDVSGNESELSVVASAEPLTGNPPTVELTTDAVSGVYGFTATLTASGAETYDFDLDGDGEFDDVVADTTGSAFVNTDLPGIVRPAVRGVDADGRIAFAAVALIITLNNRPVASAQAAPSSGQVPLVVTFTGIGEDEDGTIAHYYWDFDGNGAYDPEGNDQQNPEHTYSTVGLYNAKLRVEDDRGAWDVDTVSVNALPDPINQMPVITGISASPGISPTGEEVSFTAAAFDPDGSITTWEWDFENDDSFDSTEQNPTHAYADEGNYNAKLKVTDDDGGYAVEFVSVIVKNGLSNFPPRITALRDTGGGGGKPPYSAYFMSAAEDVDGSVVMFSWDFDNNGVIDDSGGNLTNPVWVYNNPGYYTAMLMVEDDDGATTQAYIGINVLSNVPPVAILQVTPRVSFVGETGWQTVTFDASSSYDPDTPTGPTLEYAFDPKGFGGFTSYQSNPLYAAYYWYPGVYTAQLRVKDEDNAFSEDSQTLWVYQFEPFRAITSGNVGEHLSLGVALGAPAVSYYDTVNCDLKYARATDNRGINWAPPVTVASVNDVGQFSCLIDVNGRPAIAFYDATNGDLKYVRAKDSYGDTWGTVKTPDATNDVGQAISMAVVAGYPAIAYYDATSSDLKYVRASNAEGSLWGTPVKVAETGDVGRYPSLAVINGNPAISYYDATHGYLKYVRASDATGSSWGSPVTVDDGSGGTNDVGRWTSLAMLENYPGIAYQDFTNRDLMFVSATDANGSTWGTPLTVDPSGSAGEYAKLIFVYPYAMPAIAYRDGVNEDTNFVMARDADGAAWQKPIVVDSEGDMGRYVSVALLNGRPCIAYRDGTNQDIIFAYPMTE